MLDKRNTRKMGFFNKRASGILIILFVILCKGSLCRASGPKQRSIDAETIQEDSINYARKGRSIHETHDIETTPSEAGPDAPIQTHGTHPDEESHGAVHEKDGPISFDETGITKSVWSSLPLWIILIPLIGGIAIAFLTDDQLGGNLLVLFTGIPFVLSVFLYKPVINGIYRNGVLLKGIFLEVPFIPEFGFNLTFKIDPINMTLVIFTGLVWLLTALFSKSYLEIEGNRKRYNIANCCCLAVTIGAFMAGDFFTLYIFYEAILIFLYLMVVHREDSSAIKASKVYLYLGVATGLILLYGIFLLYHLTGSVEIKNLGMALSSAPHWARYIVAAMLVIGFGGKAGIFLEHIWMPHSYGSAPCLTAALSSGIMIEVGAYGILRTVNMIFPPLGTHMLSSLWTAPSSLLWVETSHVGHVLIWIGIMTMFFGALNALISNHSLKLLAYSSVSQMGYIIMGIGCAAYMGAEGAMGLTGAVYHIINHALFKVALFLCVGAVYFHTKETDIRRLGGLWRNMPIAAFVMFISLCAISGVPGFNGFASKTMLHHAIVEAYEHSIYILGRPDKWLRSAEVIFIITAGCTFAYNIKLFCLIFLGKMPKKYKHIKGLPSPMKIALSTLGTLILFMGLFPNWFLNHFLGPMLSYFGFNPASHAYHSIYNIHAQRGVASTIPILYNPITKAFFSSSEVIHNLISGSSAIMLGGIILVLGLTFGLFLQQMPERLTTEYYYRSIFSRFLALCTLVYRTIVYWGEVFIGKCMVYVWMTPLRMEQVISPRLKDMGLEEKEILDYISGIEAEHGKLDIDKKTMFNYISKLDKKYDEIIEKPMSDKRLFKSITNADEKLSKSLDKIMQNNDIFTKISKVDERLSGSLDKAIKKRNVFDKVTSADDQFDGLVDKIIFSRLFWGVIARKDSSLLPSDLFKKFTNMEHKYDSLIERLLFGMIGSEDLSKIKLDRSDFARSWFLNICKKAATIHTGDISNYISWIAIALTVIIVILVGIPYLATPFAIILAITLAIFVICILAILFL